MQEFSLPHFGMVLITFGQDRPSAANHLIRRLPRWFAALGLSWLGVGATVQGSALRGTVPLGSLCPHPTDSGPPQVTPSFDHQCCKVELGPPVVKTSRRPLPQETALGL
jgi:hypothetical protein